MSALPKPLCRHCGRYNVNRPRGLCRRCWHRLDIRDLYQSGLRGAERGLGLVAPTKLPAEPTRAPRGSEEKIKIMRERLERDEHLRHEEDGE